MASDSERRAKLPWGQDAERVHLRLPDGLRDRLKRVAELNGRSMNSEIVARLEASLGSSAPIDPEIARLLESHINAKVAERLKDIAKSIGGEK
ncbi:Arc family DNA-binding protein [Neorhizobium sp. NCHU2750]|uniref:Arc family DNA-binding protein n=1 Tax=Neorhizobium sp. NCHU2750 TaxID=1825976 RepID=UPI000E76FAA6|nr:hypothetical protein NCHU2750_05860 [Neorhizobium sp. NCHU2750]